MNIPETDQASVLEQLQAYSGRTAIYLFTPLCGTCKLGERMLEIALAAGASVPLSKLNINYAPQLREKWRISSVPCLVLLEHGSPVKKEYAMQAVDHVYSLLKE
ncbi:Thioredoxin [compost metagenome]